MGFASWFAPRATSTSSRPPLDHRRRARDDIADRARAVLVESANSQALTTSRVPDLTDGKGVTYAARDRARNIEFVAHLPEGSKLAQDAQALSLEVYTGRQAVANTRTLEYHSTNPRLIDDGNSTSRILPTFTTVPYRSSTSIRHNSHDANVITVEPEGRSSAQRRHSPDPIPGESVRRYTVTDDDDSPRIARTSTSGSRDYRGRMTPPQKACGTKPRQSFRHTSDTHETYVMRGNNELYVSAPIGSHEAEIHQRVAAAAAGNGLRKIENSARWEQLLEQELVLA